MSKIVRKNQKIFALNNDATQNFGNGVFGSGKTGAKTITNDVEALQGLSAYLVGWKDAVLTDAAGNPNLPPLEEFQAIDYICTYQLAYIFQEGIPEWNTLTTYFQKGIVKKTTTYELYGSVTDNNAGNALTDPTNWALLADLSKVTYTDNSSSVDYEMAIWDSTGGRKLKRSNLTGLIKSTSGVVSAASAGSDYLAPNGNGSALTGITAGQISGLSFPLNFTSSDQTITFGGTVSVSHGFGTVPSMIVLLLICQTGEYGYTAGQIVFSNPAGDISSASSGISVIISNSSITLRYGNTAVGLTNASDGNSVTMTAANWKARIKAWS